MGVYDFRYPTERKMGSRQRQVHLRFKSDSQRTLKNRATSRKGSHFRDLTETVVSPNGPKGTEQRATHSRLRIRFCVFDSRSDARFRISLQSCERGSP